MIDRTNYLADDCPQIIHRTGFVSVNTRFQITPKEKITRWKIGRARGAQGTVSETGNEVPGKRVSKNGHCQVSHCYWSGQPRGKECRPPRPAPPRPTYCVLTYLLTPWSRVLLEKLTGSAASQEIPLIFGTCVVHSWSTVREKSNSFITWFL